MAAIIVFSLLILLVYKGYCFRLNYQLAMADKSCPVKAKKQPRGWLIMFQLGNVFAKLEFQAI